jgi:hypothetical protein
MRKAGVVALTVAILTLVLVSAGCGGKTTEAKPWATVLEYFQDWTPSSGIFLTSTTPFELTGAPCRLRYETMNSFVLHVYIVPQDEPTKRQSVLDRRDSPRDGETIVSVEPGMYYLDIEGVSDCQRYHLWLEEQRQAPDWPPPSSAVGGSLL